MATNSLVHMPFSELIQEKRLVDSDAFSEREKNMNRLHSYSHSNSLSLSAQHYLLSPRQSHPDSPSRCSSPHLSLQLSCCLRLLNATASTPEHPCKREIPSFALLVVSITVKSGDGICLSITMMEHGGKLIFQPGPKKTHWKESIRYLEQNMSVSIFTPSKQGGDLDY